MTLAELKQHTLSMFLPPRELTVSEWADENRVLVSNNSAAPGRWDTNFAPFQREIMDAFTDPKTETIVIKSSAQVGKSEILNNCIGRTIDCDPGPMMMVQTTEEAAKAYSKERIAPMIESCPTLSAKVSDPKTRDGGNTLKSKTFPGGFLAFAGANAPSGLRSKPIRYLFMDEVEGYPASAGTEGDPVKLAIMRTATFPNRKIMMCSTPLLAENSRIDKAYKQGTQEEWCVQCPVCGEYSFVKFDDIRFEHSEETVGGEKQYEEWDIRWRCPNCMKEHNEYDVKRMKAKWIPRNVKAIGKGTRSFHMNAFISPWCSWKTLVHEFLTSHEDENQLQVFVNTKLGETWELRDRSGKPEELYRRREWYNAEVPEGALVLTCGIDTQDNRLEYEVVGWGRMEESWGIQYGVIPGDPDTEEVWNQLDDVLDREWKLPNGKAIKITVSFIDRGGHKADSVVNHCLQRTHKRIYPIIGIRGDGKPYAELNKQTGHVEFRICVSNGKAGIMSATAVQQPGGRYCHFPQNEKTGYTLDYFRGLISESIVVHTKNGVNVAQWEKMQGVRNEPLDCRNYARAAFKAFSFEAQFDKIERRLRGIPEAPKQSEQRKSALVSPGIKV